MPAPNLGLVGAYGAAGVQKAIQDMVAERRAAEALAYERSTAERDWQAKQQEAEQTAAYRKAMQEYQMGDLSVRQAEAAARLAAANQRPKPIVHAGLAGVDPTDKGKYTVGIDPDTGERRWQLREAETEPKPQNLTPLESYLAQRNQEQIDKGGKPFTSEEVKAATREYNLGTTREPQGRPTEMTDTAKFYAVQRIGNQWDSISAPYRETKNAADRMAAGLAIAQRDPSQWKIVAEPLRTLFVKGTEPNSVVMPSEFERGGLSQPVWDRAKAFLQIFDAGGVPGIPNEEWPKYLEAARAFQGAMEKNLRSKVDLYKKRAEGFGLDPSMIIDDDFLRPGALTGGGGGTGGGAGAGGTGATGTTAGPYAGEKRLAKDGKTWLGKDKNGRVVELTRNPDGTYTIK